MRAISAAAKLDKAVMDVNRQVSAVRTAPLRDKSRRFLISVLTSHACAALSPLSADKFDNCLFDQFSLHVFRRDLVGCNLGIRAVGVTNVPEVYFSLFRKCTD